MKRKIPKTIILLIVVFIWSFGKSIEQLLRYSTSTDYFIFSHNGIGFLFFVFLIILLLLYGLTIWFLWKPKPIGFWIAISSLIVSSMENVVTFSIAINNIESVKNAYALSRQARGLIVRKEAIEMIFSPGVMYIMLGFAVCLAFLWAALLIWKKSYFALQRSINETQQSLGR